MSDLNYSENMLSYFYDNYLYSDQSLKLIKDDQIHNFLLHNYCVKLLKCIVRYYDLLQSGYKNYELSLISIKKYNLMILCIFINDILM